MYILFGSLSYNVFYLFDIYILYYKVFILSISIHFYVFVKTVLLVGYIWEGELASGSWTPHQLQWVLSGPGSIISHRFLRESAFSVNYFNARCKSNI